MSDSRSYLKRISMALYFKAMVKEILYTPNSYVSARIYIENNKGDYDVISSIIGYKHCQKFIAEV